MTSLYSTTAPDCHTGQSKGTQISHAQLQSYFFLGSGIQNSFCVLLPKKYKIHLSFYSTCCTWDTYMYIFASPALCPKSFYLMHSLVMPGNQFFILDLFMLCFLLSLTELNKYFCFEFMKHIDNSQYFSCNKCDLWKYQTTRQLTLLQYRPYPLSICTWCLTFCSLTFWVWWTVFFPSLNWIFACTQVVKIKFIRLEISN